MWFVRAVEIVSRCWNSKVRKYFLDAIAAASITNKPIGTKCVSWNNQYVVRCQQQQHTTTNQQNETKRNERPTDRPNKRTSTNTYIICNTLNGIYKETNACYIYDLFILCCNFRARQPNYAKRTCFSVACIYRLKCTHTHTYFRSLCRCVHIGRPECCEWIKFNSNAVWNECESEHVNDMSVRAGKQAPNKCTNNKPTTNRSTNRPASQTELTEHTFGVYNFRDLCTLDKNVYTSHSGETIKEKIARARVHALFVNDTHFFDFHSSI